MGLYDKLIIGKIIEVVLRDNLKSYKVVDNMIHQIIDTIVPMDVRWIDKFGKEHFDDIDDLMGGIFEFEDGSVIKLEYVKRELDEEFDYINYPMQTPTGS